MGERKTGKSWIARNIIHNLNTNEHFLKNSLIISPSEQFNPFYSLSPLLSGVEILYKYNSEKIKSFLQKCKDNMHNNAPEKNGCIVLDACISENEWYENAILMVLVTNYRDYGISLIIVGSFQKMPIIVTNNNDYFFLLKEICIVNKKRLYDVCRRCGMFKTFKKFDRRLTALTNDYSAMVVDDTEKTNEVIFWFRAKLN